MKILFFGDRHYREVKPGSRIDNFEQASLEKDKEILDLAKSENIDLILHPGDLFDKPDVSNEYFMNILERWTNPDFTKHLNSMNLDMSNRSIEGLKPLDNTIIPMASVIGNHDVYGADTSTIMNTRLGLMNYLGINKLVSRENPYYITTEDGLKVAITGTNYHTNIDKPEHIDDYIIEEKLGDYHIHIVHGMLLDKKVSDDIFRNTVVDDILHTNADITLSGHDHIGFGILEKDGKYFANPGAVMRLTADKKELNRRPKVIIIEITKEQGVSMKEVYLKSAKPGLEVLDRTLIEDTKRKKKLQDEYNKQVKEFSLTERADIYEALEHIAKNEKVKDIYKDDLIKRTRKKEEQMKVKSSANEEIYIEKLILNNFQSHVNTSLDFNNGFNVLIGESSTGKTSIIRAIRWIYENKPSGRDFITVGKDYAMATVQLSNGYRISRKIEKKSSGFNGYIIKDPSGEITEGNTTLLPEIQRIIGFNDFKIDKDLTVPLNFMMQGDSWFLIGDKYSSIDRAKIIGAVKGTHYIDAVKRDLDRENRSIKSEIKKDEKEIKRLEVDLKEFDYLKDLEKLIKDISQRSDNIKLAKNKIDKIKSLTTQMDEVNNEVKVCNKIIKDTNKIKDVKTKYEISKSLKNKEDSIIKLAKELKTTEDEVVKNKVIIKETSNIKLLKEKAKLVKSSQEKLVKLTKINDNYTKTLRAFFSSSNFIEVSSKLIDCKTIYSEVETMYKKLEQLEKLKNNYKETYSQLLNANKFIVLSKDVEYGKEIMNNNREYLNKLYKIKSLKASLKEEIVRVKQLDSIIKGTSKNDDIKLKQDKVNDCINRLSNIEKIILNKENIELKIEIENKTIKTQDEKIRKENQTYVEKLNHLNTCPTCLTKITQKQKDFIIKSKLKK